MKAKLVEVIKTKSLVGDGTPDDPYREILGYWTKDGRLIVEIDNREGLRSEFLGKSL